MILFEFGIKGRTVMSREVLICLHFSQRGEIRVSCVKTLISFFEIFSAKKIKLGMGN
jgi:hypothetical protein